MLKSLLLAILLPFCVAAAAEIHSQTVENVKTHEVKATPVRVVPVTGEATPKHIIYMIGDGMGAEQVCAAWICNKGKLNITRMPVTGLSKTYSASHLVTDSAAGGTALACGRRTNNGWLGLAPDRTPLVSLAATARSSGMATGLVVTKAITDATPAAFYAHVDDRNKAKQIAAELVKTPFTVVTGGGAKHFKEEDVAAMKAAGTAVALVAEEHRPVTGECSDFLPEATAQALATLEKDPEGFFLMVEGSNIDSAGHKHNLQGVVCETLDFDRAVGVVLDWMESHPDTLLVITADHQTGGLVIRDGSIADGRVKAVFAADSHNGMMVPIYAAGMGADRFSGVMDNTDIPARIKALLPEKK